MTSLRIPLAVPDLRGREAEYLARCVADNWVSSAGPYVTQFEAAVARAAGRAHAVAIVNGTAALHLALLVAGVRPGDRVIVPDFTFAASAHAVYHAGATPYFVDVAPADWTLDPELVAQALAQPGPRIAAVMAVHALGLPAAMEELGAVAKHAGVPLIADAAAALGASYRGRPAGAFGDAAVFSFNGNKTVTAGGGGMIATDRADWAAKARSLSTQARSGSRYRHDAIAFNYRLTNVNAAIGLAQMERLDEMTAAKRRIAAAYDCAIAGRADLTAMPHREGAESSCWLAGVRCASAADAESLVAALNAQGIEARLFWEALSAQAPYAGAPVLSRGVAAGLSGCVVSLPCSSSLTETELATVIAALGRWRGAALRPAA